MTIKNMDGLVKVLQPKLETAITNVAVYFTDKLREYISEEIYENNKVMLLQNISSSLKSANYSVKSIPSGASARIFTPKDIIDNLKDKNGNDVDITLDDSSLNEFIEYCNKNYTKVLKMELVKLGIPIQ